MESSNQPIQPLPQPTRARRWRVWLILALVGVGALLVGLRFAARRPLDPHQIVRPRVGAPLSDFELKDLQGKLVRLSDYRGKVVLVNAWAAWCAPCKAEMPLLDRYYQAHKSQGFEVLAVNAADPRPFMMDFLKSSTPSFPVLLDPDVLVVGRLWIEDLPTSILVDQDGLVKQVHVGMYTADTLEMEVTPLLPR